MRRTFSSSSPSSSSSSPSLNPAATAIAVATTAAAAALYFYHQHHHSPKHRQARAEERAYLDALHHIALSAGAARLGAPISPQQIDDDETRYARRHAFFTHFFTDILGGDQKHYKFVHVTGTKGKGTVCELVRCGLIAHGKRVGTFTSPHLHTVRERIRVNDVLISKADFVRLWAKVQAALTASSTDGGCWANFFDKVLGVALAWFVEQRVEYIILEVGIGGRYDPTNFIARPAVCVVTSVSKDHTELLGKSLEAIAWQKAGILKGGGDTICLTPAAPTQDPAVLRVLQAEAEKVGCLIEEIILAPSSSPIPSPASSPTSSPTSASSSSSVPPSPQAPQTIRGVEVHPENFALAKGTLKTLLLSSSGGGWGGGKGTSRTMLMRRGWETKAFWPGRFELFPLRLEGGREGMWVGRKGGRPQKQRPREALLILDVAHNTDSVAKLLQEIRRRFFPGYSSSSSSSSSSTTQRRCALWVLYGTGNDKDAQGMLDILLSNSSTSFPSSLPSSSSTGDLKPLDRLIFCHAKHPRARSVDDLATFLPPSLLPSLDNPPTERTRTRRTRRRKGEERKTEVTVPSAAFGTTPDKALAQLLRDINPEGEDEDEDEGEEEGGKVEGEEEWEEEGEEKEEDVVLVVCGSFFVVSAARAYLAKHRPEMLRETDWAFEADPPLYT